MDLLAQVIRSGPRRPPLLTNGDLELHQALLELRDLVAGHAFMGAEAIIITGPHTGSPAATRDLEVAAEAGDRPVIVGSGATPDHLESLFRNATGVIVGSALKEDGDWRRDLCPDRIRAFIDGRG